MSEKEAVLGIDLGLSNVRVAAGESGRASCIPGRDSRNSIPAVVVETQTGRLTVGILAKRQATMNSECAVRHLRNLLGQRWDGVDVWALRRVCACNLIEGPRNDVRVALPNKIYTPQELLVPLLLECRAAAERFGHTARRVVVSVPSSFDEDQRAAVREAAALAGLELLGLVDEPKAVAFAYGVEELAGKIVAVYDLGGARFELSVLDVGADGVFRTIASAADESVGGEAIDDKMIDLILEDLPLSRRIDVRDDHMAMQRLRDATEEAKCGLSVVSELCVDLPQLLPAEAEGEGLHLTRPFDRACLTNLSREVLETSFAVCERALAEAGVRKEALDEVILTGGTTMAPWVQRAVAEFFDIEPRKEIPPDEVVCQGAALHGLALLGGVRHKAARGAMPHSLGILLGGGAVDQLVALNASVPTTASRTFTTARDNQDKLRIVLVKRRPGVDRDEMVRDLSVVGLRKAPKGQVDVEVTFHVDETGGVGLAARDVRTGEEYRVV